MKPQKLLFALLIVLLTAGLAWSSGAWEHMYDNPAHISFYWSYYNDLAMVSDTKLVAGGYFQHSLTTVQTVWKSTDQGTSFTPTKSRTGSGNPCNLVRGMFNIQSIDYFHGTNNGVFVGGATNPLCSLVLPFPECLVCVLEYEPAVWYSVDDGATLTEVSRDLLEWYKAYMKVQTLDSYHSWAVGTGNSIIRSDHNEDNDLEWRPPTGVPDNRNITDFLDLHFFTPDYGWLAVAVNRDGDDKMRDPKTPEEIAESFDYFQAKQAWASNPRIRLLMRRYGIDEKETYAEGKICKTEDSGGAWQCTYYFQDTGVNRVSFSSEKRGILSTYDIAKANGPSFKVWYTGSSGMAWTEASLPATGPHTGGAYDIGDLHMVTSALGFIGGAEDDGSSDMTGFLLVTHDGGKTWTADPYQPDYPINSFDIKDRTLGFAVGEKRITLRYTGENSIPEADAGPDQHVMQGDVVTLNAMNSTDEDDLDLEFEWSQLTGETMVLDRPDFVSTDFNATKKGVFTFQVKVSDPLIYDTDQVKIYVDDDDDDDDTAGDDDDDDTTGDDDDTSGDDDDTLFDDDDSNDIYDPDNDQGGNAPADDGGGGCCG